MWQFPRKIGGHCDLKFGPTRGPRLLRQVEKKMERITVMYHLRFCLIHALQVEIFMQHLFLQLTTLTQNKNFLIGNKHTLLIRNLCTIIQRYQNWGYVTAMTIQIHNGKIIKTTEYAVKCCRRHQRIFSTRRSFTRQQYNVTSFNFARQIQCSLASAI